MLSFVLTVLLCLPILIESKSEWSYKNMTGWARARDNHYCRGHSQSPIDLRFDISQYDGRLKQISLEERGSKDSVEFVNNGHTVQLNLKGRYVLKNVAPGSEDYNVEQIHFHWGRQNDNKYGSEHLHGGRSFPLEMHMVTYSSLYSSIGDAMYNTRSLAVVGVFFEVSDEQNPLLQPIVDALQHVRNPTGRTPFNGDLNLKKLIGEDRLRRYYRYDGSLTTPPCYESVIWTVALEPIKLSQDQLHAFQNLYAKHDEIMENTYRSVQPLGTRKLFRSFHSENIQEDREHQQRMATKEGNNGQNLKNNMSIIALLVSLLMFVNH